MSFSRSRAVTLAAAVVTGALLGIIAPMLSSGVGTVGQVASLVLSAGWAWAALAFAVGLSQTSRTASAAFGCIFLIAAVIAYYATKTARGDFQTMDIHNPVLGEVHTNWGGVLGKTLVWCAMAVVLGTLITSRNPRSRPTDLETR
ncbi:hypothetical protein AB0L06_40575 [Spirillospora sp. NPDC052269]